MFKKTLVQSFPFSLVLIFRIIYLARKMQERSGRFCGRPKEHVDLEESVWIRSFLSALWRKNFWPLTKKNSVLFWIWKRSSASYDK